MNKEDANNLSINLDVLNRIEKINSLVSTTVRYIENDVYLVEGSKIWLNSTFSLHLYTFLLKAMCYLYQDKENWLEELKEENTNEGTYASSFIPQFSIIISKHLKSLFNKGLSVHGYPEDYNSISFIHDNSGVMTLFRKEASYYLSTKNNGYYKRLIKLFGKL